jgi:hypothetical protein
LSANQGFDALFPTPWKHQHNNGWSSTTTQAEDSPSRKLLTNLVLASYGRIDREWQRVPPEEGARLATTPADDLGRLERRR